MNEVLHANIFFLIASLATILFTLLLSLVLFQLWKIVKAVRRIVERVEAGSEVIAEDLESLRDNFNPARLVQLVMSWMPMGQTKRRRKTKPDEE